MNAHDKFTLEAMIDSSSLESVLEAIFEICHEKEHHILTNWRGLDPLAMEWRKAGHRVRRATLALHDKEMHKTPGIQSSWRP